MKKSLIALAVLAASGASFAQSSVTIFGTFDPSLASQKTTYGNNSAVTNQLVRNNSQGTSQISFKGVEDLGGGLKASFLFENDFDAGLKADNNFSSKGGELFLALEGGFGKIAAGAPNTPTLTAQAASNPFGTKIGGGFGQVNSGKVRNSNTVMYSTPAVSGFSAAVAYSNAAKDSTGATTTASITDIGVNYANGPLAAGYSNYTVAAFGSTAEKKDGNLYATYDLGVVKLGVASFTQKQGTTVNSQGRNLSATVPVSASLSVLANFGANNDKTSANLDSKINAVGLKYTLSKTTSIYARSVSQTYDNVAATATKKVQTNLIGVQTNF